MSKNRLRYLLGFSDWLMAAISWALFFYYRQTIIEEKEFTINEAFYLGVSILPIIWIILYYIQGTYHDILHSHRMKILSQTFFASMIGVLSLFFVLLIDDDIKTNSSYYQKFLFLFGLHFVITLLPRWAIVQYIVRRIHSRRYGFRTLLVGGSEKAVEIYQEINKLPHGTGNKFVGFVNLNGIDRLLEDELPYLGHADNIEEVVEKYGIEEVIIALDSTEHEKLSNLVSRIDGSKIRIKILSDMYDILSGSVKMTNIFGALLIEINTDSMPIWQESIKRILDFVFSTVAIILLIPVYLILAISVKLSSKGPIFFRQERVGLKGRKFMIIKFRSMYVEAENDGPQLSSENDPRITASGRIMRKMRLDEFPQFFNVLMGEMSLVGPRPERQFFIDQISKIEPQYSQLTRVRPGITSWGQVKFGYAESVEQMLQRMKYDLLYLKNRSIALDFKILLYTVSIILKGKGK